MIIACGECRPNIDPEAWVAQDATICGDVTIGDPAQILPPENHQAIWALQKSLDFPRFVYGLDRNMPILMRAAMTRLSEELEVHRTDVNME